MEKELLNKELNYDMPIKVADGIYWIGFYDKEEKLHSNPYLIIEGDEAVVIDGGSRPNFATVMMKILQTGIEPSKIKYLIYQHYDPDLCGSVANFEDIIDTGELKILSQKYNNIFIKYYSALSPMLCIDEIGRKFKFSSGRELKFIHTPYVHTAGSFITYDVKTRTAFTSDIFGSYSTNDDWELFMALFPECYKCKDKNVNACILKKKYCPVSDIIDFHRIIGTSEKALKYAVNMIFREKIDIIAPQHGSVITSKEDIEFLKDVLINLNDVGIDYIIKDGNNNEK